VKVKVLTIGSPTVAGHVYGINAAASILLQGKKLMKTQPIFGELCPSNTSLTVDLAKVSHEITDLSIENGAVYAKVRVLDTPSGEILKHLETAGVQPVYAVRGSGNIDANGVVSNFQLISIDVVGYTS